MFNIRHPVRTWFGAGTVEKVRDEAEFAGAKKALVFTDKGVLGAGIAARAIEPLKAAGLDVTVYGECAPEPAIADLESAYERFRDESFDFVVGIGGGSSMDLAKSMSVLFTNPGEPRDYLGVELVKEPGLHCALIPTTSGTGAEATPNAIFSVPEKGVKLAIVSTYIVPNAAIVDPELTLTTPEKVTAASGVDALTHCLESFVNPNSSALSELYSVRGMELIAGSLRRVLEDGSDLEARSNMALGAYFGGVCLTSAGAGAIHALAYPLGSRFHIPHGVSNSLMFSHVVKVNFPANPAKFARIARILGEDVGGLPDEEAAGRSVAAVERLCRDCGVPTRLSKVGVPAHVIPELAEAAFTTQQRLLGFNPRELSLEDIEKIYRAAS
ncbi:MAG TPA: iron-containing alcohol dehydrogenase [Nitrospinota bacterium]|jgi:alcohol dehydrogenase class IV|nr:iron-containing alcohol dehydrogenase [Nitrospinota bacterium]